MTAADRLFDAAQAWRNAENSAGHHADVHRYQQKAIGHLIAYLQGDDDGDAA